VGLVIGVASLAVGLAVQDSSSAVRVPVALWIFVNLVWAVFNLLPIASLDGGRALRHLAGAIFPGRFGVVLGLTANLAASAILAVLAVEAGQLYIAFIAVVFGLASPDIYGMLLDALWPGRVKRRRDEDAAQIEQAREANERRAIEAGRYGEPHESIYQGDQGDSPWRRP
jgi:membrane-associated protease RseP (regulator of RpoE activity)